MGFIRINNRKNFLIDELPVMHPKSREYVEFWREHKRRCIEGFWGVDDGEVNVDVKKREVEDHNHRGKWRWMPPNLYFYVNFGIILHQPEDDNVKTAPKKKIRPLLRDFEWEFFYNFMECRGFSGFRDDDEYCCLRELDAYLKSEKKSTTAYNNLEKIAFKKDGNLKKYKPCKEYLRQLWDKPMGLPDYNNEAKNLFLLGARGGGKMLSINELVRTSKGWVEIGKLRKGDKVYGSDGNLCSVIETTPIQKGLNMYEITLRDGRSIKACEDHTWTVINKDIKSENKLQNKSTKELYKNYYNERVDSKHKAKYGEIKKIKEFKFAIPNNKSLQNEGAEPLDIHPYVLGMLIGDGSVTTKSISITTADLEVVERVEKCLGKDYTLTKCSDKYSYLIRRSNKDVEPFYKKLERLHLLGSKSEDKFIPNKYLFSSEEQKTEFIKGLFDADGYSDNTHIEYYTSSDQLSSNVLDILRSLGIACKHKSKSTHYLKDGKRINCLECNRISIYTDKPVFHLSRKLEYLKHVKSKSGRSKYNKSFIIDIQPAGKADGVCIQVDSPDSTYITKDYIVTHNSYLNAVGVILFEIIFDGARYYTEESRENPSEVEVFVGAAMAAKSGDILKKTKTAMTTLPGAWGKGKAKVPPPFFKAMRGSLKSNNVENPWRHEYIKKTGGNEEVLGSGSNIKHGTYTVENPEAAAGTRPGVMVIEEVGLLGNVLTVHASNEACQMTDGTVKFGTSIYIGTGGNVEKIQEAEIIFRDPEAYNFLSFEDEWENGGDTGWFVPAYYMDGNFKDKNGNTMMKEAIENYEERRAVKRKANSAAAIDGEMMNYPLKPSEMFLNARGNIFPLADLKEVAATIVTKKHDYENRHWFGELVMETNGSVKWENTSSKDLVREWPIKDNKNKPGVIEIAEMPKKGADGDVIQGRYIVGTDTYDDDESSTKSLGSVFVMDTWTDRLVAEYTGRRLADDFYEITRRLCLFYRAVNNYEQNKKGLYAHYKKMNSLHLLAETPEILKDVANATISKVGNRKYGTTATAQVNDYALRLILRYLVTGAYGEEEGSNIQNLHKLRFLGAVKELVAHNKDGNFDRVSALGMLMILKEDKYATLKRKDEQKEREVGLEQDEFFTERWSQDIF